MDRIFAVEVRQEQNREPELHGVMLQEGRPAENLREVFAPGSVTWPSVGVEILLEHEGEPEMRAQVVRARNGELQVLGIATERVREAIAAGKRYLSVEFKSLRERQTRGGIREIAAAFVDAAALVTSPEYSMTSAEVRSEVEGWTDDDVREIWL